MSQARPVPGVRQYDRGGSSRRGACGDVADTEAHADWAGAGEAFAALEPANGILRGRHAGQRCFILATGPSIRLQDLSPLRGELCIAVSNFFVHPLYPTLAPRYHVFAGFHPPIREPAWQAWMDEVAARTAQAALLFSARDRQRNEYGGRFADRERYYVHEGRWDAMDPGAWRGGGPSWPDLTRHVLPPQSVTVRALELALYLGCDPICLLGCDHDWICHLNQSRHFYDEREHALGRSGYDEFHGADLESYCLDYVRLWRQYKLLRRTAEEAGVRIVNATAGGMLDVFPRVELKQALALGAPARAQPGE